MNSFSRHKPLSLGGPVYAEPKILDVTRVSVTEQPLYALVWRPWTARRAVFGRGGNMNILSLIFVHI